MLRNENAMATVAVKDFESAKAFYGGKLGLDQRDVDDVAGTATYGSGKGSIVVYRSEYAGTNRATSVTWGVGEAFDDIVSELQEVGVEFKHYEMPGMHLDGDVHVANGFRAAWFTDPEGNILHINNM